MTRKFLLPILLHFVLTLNGQDLKKVKKEEKGDFGRIEIYHVLKSDKEIKHGEYEAYLKYSNPFTTTKTLTSRGWYKNNMKSGEWTYYWGEDNITSKGMYIAGEKSGTWEYFKNGKATSKCEYSNGIRNGAWKYFESETGTIEIGAYNEGKKTGVWKYYYSNIPIQIYDHSSDSLHFAYRDNTPIDIIDLNNDSLRVELDRSPQYIGYKRQFSLDLSEHSIYPSEARRLGLEGTVIIRYVVNENGTMSDYKIIKDIGGNCGQSIINAMKKNETRWLPGIYNGIEVKTILYQEVVFKLTIDPMTQMGKSTIEFK